MEKIADLIKSMPSANRNPTMEELKACLFQKRNNLPGDFQKHLLQFDSNGFVVNLGDTYNENDMYFCMTEKDLALTTMNGETVLKTSLDESGALLLEYEDGEKFYPHEAIKARI